jgi:hypothetical protein
VLKLNALIKKISATCTASLVRPHALEEHVPPLQALITYIDYLSWVTTLTEAPYQAGNDLPAARAQDRAPGRSIHLEPRGRGISTLFAL